MKKYIIQELEDTNKKLSILINVNNIYISKAYRLSTPINSSETQVNDGIRFNLEHLGNIICINKEQDSNKIPNLVEYATKQNLIYLHNIDKNPDKKQIYIKAKEVYTLKEYLSLFDEDTLNNLGISLKSEYTIYEIAQIYKKIKNLRKPMKKPKRNKTFKKVA